MAPPSRWHNLFTWLWWHASSCLPIFLLTISKHTFVALRLLEFCQRVTHGNISTILSSLGRKVLERLAMKLNGCLPHRIKLMACALYCVTLLWAVFSFWTSSRQWLQISLHTHSSWGCHFKLKLFSWRHGLNLWLVLFCSQNRQLQGLKGLFNKNPRHGSSENNNSHYIRKRSIGDRILRRTASAPAKGRKKSKVGFQEMVEIKDSVSEATRDQDGVLRRTTRSLQVRPVSMPVDKSLLGALSLPISEAAKDTDGKENSPGKMLSVPLSCIFFCPLFPWQHDYHSAIKIFWKINNF